jgi:hypothetical protein
MTTPENFVLRWARLKRASEIEPKSDTADVPPVSAASAGAEMPLAHREDELVDDPFDLASLPPIEAITVDTDIRRFLQSRVPAALTRAALRQAWASDPAIRDFIGIAENQWDFNDPTAMPGFGPMREKDDLPALLSRAMGDRDNLADIIREVPAAVENALPAMVDREPSNSDQSLQRTSERASSTDEISNLPDDSYESTATRNEGVAEGGDSSQSHRSHGGALPR